MRIPAPFGFDGRCMIMRGLMTLLTSPPSDMRSTPLGPGPPGGLSGHNGIVTDGA